MIDVGTPRSDVLRGAAWMLAGCVCVVGMQTMARHVAQTLPAVEMVFFRFLFGTVFMLPWLARAGVSALRTRRLPLYVLRATGTLVIMTCIYTALSKIPVADVTALLFTAPIFIMIGAGLFLREKVGPLRWLAVGIAFVGALIVLRPGSGAISATALLVLVGAFFNATVMLITKVLSRTESANAIVLYQSSMAAVLALPFAVWVWVEPSTATLLWLAAMGAVATAGQQCITRAFVVADASAVQPVNFSRLGFAALFGFLAFGEVPDVWVWTGGAIIFAATLLPAFERNGPRPE